MLTKILEIIVFIILLVIVNRLSRGKEQNRIKYDERQKEIIAKGHRWGF